MGWGGIDWTDLAQDKGPVEGSYENGNKPSGSIKCWEIPEQLSYWRRLKKGSVELVLFCF
jgi:hypothetical protein